MLGKHHMPSELDSLCFQPFAARLRLALNFNSQVHVLLNNWDILNPLARSAQSWSLPLTTMALHLVIPQTPSCYTRPSPRTPLQPEPLHLSPPWACTVWPGYLQTSKSPGVTLVPTGNSGTLIQSGSPLQLRILLMNRLNSIGDIEQLLTHLLPDILWPAWLDQSLHPFTASVDNPYRVSKKVPHSFFKPLIRCNLANKTPWGTNNL